VTPSTGAAALFQDKLAGPFLEDDEVDVIGVDAGAKRENIAVGGCGEGEIGEGDGVDPRFRSRRCRR